MFVDLFLLCPKVYDMYVLMLFPAYNFTKSPFFAALLEDERNT